MINNAYVQQNRNGRGRHDIEKQGAWVIFKKEKIHTETRTIRTQMR